LCISGPLIRASSRRSKRSYFRLTILFWEMTQGHPRLCHDWMA
jgi:hypothetical protein